MIWLGHERSGVVKRIKRKANRSLRKQKKRGIKYNFGDWVRTEEGYLKVGTLWFLRLSDKHYQYREGKTKFTAFAKTDGGATFINLI
jgi:hypothetical protein